MKSPRRIVRLQLDQVAKDSLDSLCEQRGMTQIAVMSRLVSWFVQQDEIAQAKILGLISDTALASLPSATLLADKPPRAGGSG